MLGYNSLKGKEYIIIKVYGLETQRFIFGRKIHPRELDQKSMLKKDLTFKRPVLVVFLMLS